MKYVGIEIESSRGKFFYSRNRGKKVFSLITNTHILQRTYQRVYVIFRVNLYRHCTFVSDNDMILNFVMYDYQKRLLHFKHSKQGA